MFFKGNNTASESKDRSICVDKQTDDLPLATIKNNMFESTHQVRVRYAETDPMNIVYYGNYAQYFEVGRVESIRQLGFTYKTMEAMGVIMPVVELHTKFVRPAHYDDNHKNNRKRITG